MATHEGSCHCGKVAYTLEGDVGPVVDCNCSICRRRGSLLAFFPRSALTLHTPEADLASYTFNTHKIRHRFCPACGIGVFGEGVDPKSGDAMVAVNVRTLPDVNLDSLQVQKFDGASH